MRLPAAMITVWFAGSPAFAQEPRDLAEKKLKDGLALQEQGRRDEALAAFQEAYRLFAAPKILFRIAAVYEEQGRYVQAIEAYQQVARDAGSSGEAELSAQARDRAGQASMKVGLIVVEAPDGTAIRVDGEDYGRLPAAANLRVAVGSHRVELTLASRGRFETLVDVQPRERTTVRVPETAWQRSPSSPPIIAPIPYRSTIPTQSEPPLVESASEAAPERPFYKKWPFWVAVGAVVAGGVVAAVVLARRDSGTESVDCASVPSASFKLDLATGSSRACP